MAEKKRSKREAEHEEELKSEDSTTESLATEEEQPVLTDQELAEQYLANWQRAQADFANFKKRSEQEKSESIKYANAILMTQLLPILDDFERAMDNRVTDSEDSTWVDGIDLIFKKFVATLESLGLAKVEATGQDFDPNYHQAVLYEEGEEGKVIEELQKGYVLQDRLLRPTMVKVGKGLDTEIATE